MQTQLASQLRQIRVANADVVDTSSILFSPKDAGRISIQSIYAMARNGIMELIRLDERFERFEDTLFGSKMASINRQQLTESENKEIDVQIKDYLFTVAPYMLLKSVQKTLEYLIRRFSIHTFNAEDFFLAVLPYHENPLFAKVFKICDLKSHLFDFLANVRKTESPIIRSTLSIQCLKDLAFLEFILNGLRNLNAHGTIPVVHLTLICAIVVDIGRTGKLKEEYVRTLIAFASNGFSSSNTEYQATALLILSQIAVNVTLSKEIITACLNNILRNSTCNMSQLVECLLLLFRNNREYEIPLKTAEQFINNTTFELSITSLAERVSVYPIIAALTPAFCQLLIDNTSYVQQLSVVSQCIHSDEIMDYITLILTNLNALINSSSSSSQLENCQKVLLSLSSSYSEAFDMYISNLPNDVELKKIASSLFYGSSHMVLKSGRTLFLSIESHEYEVRKEVCELIVTRCNEETEMNDNDKDFMKNSMFSLLQDNYYDISVMILSMKKDVLLRVMTEEDIIMMCLKVISNEQIRMKMKEEAVKSVIEASLQHLLNSDLNLISNCKEDEKLSLIYVLFYYLLCSSYQESICKLINAFPHSFMQSLHLEATDDMMTMITKTSQALYHELSVHHSITSLLHQMLSNNTHCCLFFIESILLFIRDYKDNQYNSIQQELACIVANYSIQMMDQLSTTYSSLTKMKVADFTSCTLDSILISSLSYSEEDYYRFLLKCLYILSTHITWCSETDVSCFQDILKMSSHPYSLVCYCFKSFTPQKSYYMALSNSICSTVWSHHPYQVYITLLCYCTETSIIMHSLNKIIGLLSTESTDTTLLSQLIICTMMQLSNDVLSVRSTAFIVLDTIARLIQSNNKELSMLVKLLQYIFSFKSSIRDDGKLFGIKINVLLKADKPAFDLTALSATLLPLILSCPSSFQRVYYLRLFEGLPYDISCEMTVLSATKQLYENLQKGVVLYEEWPLVLTWFFKAMTQTVQHQGEFREFLMMMMSSDCIVTIANQEHNPLTEVLRAMTPSVFNKMNTSEKLTLLHGLMILIPTHHQLDVLDVYNTINQFEITLAILHDEVLHILSLSIEEAKQEQLVIQLLTVFVEIISRNPKFNTNIQVIDLLLSVLKQLVAIVRIHAPPKENISEEERAVKGDMEIESISMAESTTVMSDTLSIFYPIQLVIETIHTIIGNYSTTEEIITPDDTNGQGSKRRRRNSISIQTEIAIPPQLLVEIIQFNLTAQITASCLQLMSLLASLHTSEMDTALFTCFEELAARIILKQDEEAFRISMSLLTYCLRRFNDETQVLKIYKIFLSCIPHIPYSHSVTLLNTLIHHSSLRYMGHITMYLLLLNNNLSIQDTNDNMELEDGSNTKKETTMSNLYLFIQTMFMGVTLNSQIQGLGVLCCFIEMIIKHKDTNNSKNNNRTHELTEILADSLPISTWDEMTLITISSFTLQFIKDIVSNISFINKVVAVKNNITTIQQFFIQIIENLLLILQSLGNRKEEIGEQSRNRKKTEDEISFLQHYRNTELLVYDVISVFSEVLTVESLLAVLNVLIHHEDSSIRKRSLLMLNKKINAGIDNLTEEECSEYIDFVHTLVEICNDEDELAVNKQTALLSLHILVQYFAADYAKEFTSCIQVIVKLITQESSGTTQVLKGSAYIVLSMLCSQLGMKMIPYLPKIVPNLLSELDTTITKVASIKEEIEILKSELEEEKDEEKEEKQKHIINERQSQLDEVYILLQSLISSLTSVVTYQGSLLSSYLRRIIIVLCSSSLLTCSHQAILGAVHVLFSLLSQKIEIRVLIPIIYDSYKEIDTTSSASLCGLYELLNNVCDVMTTKDVETQYERYWAFCVSGLETRSKGMEGEDVDRVENIVISAMVKITLKLNELQLNSLFIKTVNWMEEKSVSALDITGEGKHVTEQELPPTSKAIPFFGLLIQLSDTFKSIFTSFYGQCLDVMITYITVFNKKCRKMKEVSDEQDILFKLVKLDVLALYKCFLYDTEGWMDEEKFNLIASPLVKLLGAYFVPHYETDYESFMNTFVIPTLIQLVVCTSGHDDWWSSFNKELLIQTHSPIKYVKLAAMKVIHECFGRMSQEYLPLLPDVIPYLADLLEDEDADVEKAAQDLRIQLESVSGEELTSYLTM